MLSNNLIVLFFKSSLLVVLAVVSYAIYVDVRFASHAVLPLMEGSGGIAVCRQGLLHNFSIFELE